MPALARVEGLNSVLRAMRQLPKEAQDELRDEAQAIAEGHAADLRRVAAGYPDARVRGQAPTIRAARDRLPVVKIGGAKRVPVSRPGPNPRAGDVLFGTEFGALNGGPNDWRFPRRQDSYWLFRTLSGRQRQVVRQWGDAVDKVARKWGVIR